jgi:hypothetical protein
VWQQIAVLLALLLSANATLAQNIGSNDPQHTLIYKVNGKCGDTIRMTRHPTSYRAAWLSKTRCPVNLGFGKIFLAAANSWLILENNQMVLLAGGYRDRILDFKPGEQQIVSPHGFYRVKLSEETLLFGKWKTWTFVFKPDDAAASTVRLRFNAVLGILAIQNLDRKGTTVGEIELVKVDGKALEQFVKDSPVR